METATLTYVTAIISAASGLLGGLIGGLVTWFIQRARFQHELRAERERRQAEGSVDFERKRADFRRRIWEHETQSLIKIKTNVRSVLDRFRRSMSSGTDRELTPRFNEIQVATSAVTRYRILEGRIFAFLRDARLFLAAVKQENLSVLGSDKYKTLYDMGQDILDECDRIILRQPDLTVKERFRRAIAYITQDLIDRTIFLPDDERTRETLVDYFMALRDEETVDFLFDDPELMDMTTEFQKCASILFDGCDVTRTGGISAEDQTYNIEKMKALAARIRDRTMQYP